MKLSAFFAFIAYCAITAKCQYQHNWVTFQLWKNNLNKSIYILQHQTIIHIQKVLKGKIYNFKYTLCQPSCFQLGHLTHFESLYCEENIPSLSAPSWHLKKFKPISACWVLVQLSTNTSSKLSIHDTVYDASNEQQLVVEYAKSFIPNTDTN